VHNKQALHLRLKVIVVRVAEAGKPAVAEAEGAAVRRTRLHRAQRT
jgi:hypothetical protein